MKRKQRLIILSGVLVICVAGAIVISRTDFEEKMSGTETVIVDVDSSDITYLSWNYEDDEMAFVCKDGKWSSDTDDKMEVDQDLLNEIAENLSDITSEKKVEEVQSLGVYGLSSPAYNITIKTSDSTYEIAVGDETFSDGEVYISDGDGYVYLTDSSLIDHISYTLLDCAEKEEIPEMESISELTVVNDDTEDIVYKKNSGYCYSDAYTYYMKGNDGWKNLDNESTEETFQTLSGFTWKKCVDYYAEDSELASYGLEEPDASVSITYEPSEDKDTSGEGKEQKFEYEVGKADDTYYARLKDSRIIYSISEDVYNAAVNASYEELKPDEVILLDRDTVESIDLELDGSIYEISVKNDGEDGYTYTLQDEEIDFGDVMDQLDGLTVADGSEDEDMPEGEPELKSNKEELKLTFHRNTEKYSTVELTFYQYDGSWCIAVLDGDEMNYTDRASVVDFKEAVNSVILDSSSGK